MNVHLPPALTNADIIFDRAVMIDQRREKVMIIVRKWRTRQNWVRSCTKLTLQAKAICRSFCEGDKTKAKAAYDIIDDFLTVRNKRILYEVECRGAAESGARAPRRRTFREVNPPSADSLEGAILRDIAPLEDARRMIMTYRLPLEAELNCLASEMPGAELCAATKGVGTKGTSLAGIIGEAGDLAAYTTPSALVKRMGLAVIDGQRQRRMKGGDAKRHGYNAERRAVMSVIGAGMMKAGNTELYNEWKAIYLPRCYAMAASKPIELDPETREPKKYSPKLHAHNMAKRIIEKRFLIQMWAAWNSVTPTEADLAGIDAEPIRRKASLAARISHAIGDRALDRGLLLYRLSVDAPVFLGALRGDFALVEEAEMKEWLQKIKDLP